MDVRKGSASLNFSILDDESPWFETSLTNPSPTGGWFLGFSLATLLNPGRL
jgi:hypothetical protein